MLKVVELNSWEEFEKEIKQKMKREIEGRILMGSGIDTYDPLLYRGQTNAEWGLDTTLERHIGNDKSIIFYNKLIKKILSEIETFTGKKWEVDLGEIKNEELADIYRLPKSIMKLMPLEFMSYLRHYGFPSPLLDWSSSPYVAAYFAFRDTASTAEQVAIYEYHQIYNHLTIKRRDTIITPLWDIDGVRNNKRHYNQQSIYTICVNTETENPYFASHESVYQLANEIEKFDGQNKGEFITKYVLPSDERENALMHLEMYNINSFSLMGTEESLLETLFARHVNPYKALKKWRPNGHSWWD